MQGRRKAGKAAGQEGGRRRKTTGAVRAGMPITAGRPGCNPCDVESIIPDEIEQALQRDYLEVFQGGTLTGEGSDWKGAVTLTKMEPFLSAGSSAIQSADLLPRSGSSRNHPNPFTPTTALQFSLPRASSIGLAIYEDTALLAGLLKQWVTCGAPR